MNHNVVKACMNCLFGETNLPITKTFINHVLKNLQKWCIFIFFAKFKGHDESSVALTGPTYETYLPPDNSTGDVFLTESPYDLIVAGKFAKVPIIMGFVACETCATVSATLKNPTFIKKLNHQWGRIAPNALFISNTAEDPALVSQAIKAHFLGDDYINETIYSKFEALYSDRQFVHSTRIYAEIYAKHVPVYLYNFTQMVPIVKFGTATEGTEKRFFLVF